MSNISICVGAIFTTQIDSIAYGIFFIIIFIFQIHTSQNSSVKEGFSKRDGFLQFYSCTDRHKKKFSDKVKQWIRDQQGSWVPSDLVSVTTLLVNHCVLYWKRLSNICLRNHFEIIFFLDNVVTWMFFVMLYQQLSTSELFKSQSCIIFTEKLIGHFFVSGNRLVGYLGI